MLDLIRRRQKTTLVKIVFWVIIATFIGTIFLVWGKGGEQSRKMTVAAQVNGTDISFDDFKSTYSNMYNFYKKIYGQNFSAELEEKIGLSRLAINSLIDQTLLLQEAERQHLAVPKEALVKAIASIPAFQVDGKFSKERYVTVLSYQRMKPELFEQIQRRQMMIAMAQNKLRSEVTVTDEDVVAEYRRLNEKINLEYIPFAATLFVKQVTPTEQQLADYYEENRESLRVPEQVELAFVHLNPKDYLDQVSFDDADVEQYYNRHLSEYDVPEQSAVAHILIRVAVDADKKTQVEKKKLAEQILAKAQNGDFAALAKKYSQDKATSAKGGELGFFKRGVMDPAFEDAAFDLAKDAVALIKSNIGYHVIKGMGHIDGGFKSLSEVASAVKAAIVNDMAGRLAYEKAMDAYNINRKQGGLSAAAEQLKCAVVKTGLFTRGEAIPAIGKNDELSKRAFSAVKGQLLTPVKTSQGVFLCEVVEKQDSYIPELSAVLPQVKEAVRKQEAIKLAQQRAEAALKELLAGKPMKTLVPAGGSIGETGLFSRAMGGFVPKLGNVPRLSDAAFALTIKNPVADQVFVAGETFYIVRLKQFNPADPNALTAEESERLRDNVQRSKRDTLFKEKLAKLKADAEVVISPAIMRSIEGENK